MKRTAQEVRPAAGDTEGQVPRWLWNAVVWGLAAVLLAAAALVIALLLGWNDPRPSGPPDWRAPGLPRIVEAPVDTTVVILLGYPGLGGEANPAAFIIEGLVAAVSGPAFNGYGLAFYAQDDAHYSVFALGSDGYYAILRIAGDQESPLVTWQQFPHIRREREMNRVRIECSGSACDFYINDEYATTVEDADWGAGDVGLWVRSFEEQAVEAEFSSLGIWSLNAANR